MAARSWERIESAAMNDLSPVRTSDRVPPRMESIYIRASQIRDSLYARGSTMTPLVGIGSARAHTNGNVQTN